jgi:hypothetical protein
MATDLQHEEFLKHLNTKFRIHVSETEVLESELTDISERMMSPRQERFSLVFRTGNETLIEQGQRTFDHDEMGNFSLFIVPIGRDDEGTYYEAVFNRLIKKS